MVCSFGDGPPAQTPHTEPQAVLTCRRGDLGGGAGRAAGGRLGRGHAAALVGTPVLRGRAQQVVQDVDDGADVPLRPPHPVLKRGVQRAWNRQTGVVSQRGGG